VYEQCAKFKGANITAIDAQTAALIDSDWVTIIICADGWVTGIDG
jgi:hypothetical protein